jgi:membrane protein implicated in regulation of membrane protease activity
MIVLLSAAFIGALATCAALWTHGALIALAATPFGGSFLAVVAALLLALLKARREQKQERSAQAPEEEPRAAA